MSARDTRTEREKRTADLRGLCGALVCARNLESVGLDATEYWQAAHDFAARRLGVDIPKPRRTRKATPKPAAPATTQHHPYLAFIRGKTQVEHDSGFNPLFEPAFLFDFQSALVGWALRKGRAAIFADCGLGKTPMQLVWAENVLRKTNRSVLILTPLAVASQTVREGEKFGIKVHRETGPGARIVVTNYERLHHFDRHDFAGVVCDESSILKSFDGTTRAAITDFMRETPYRLLCTATAAPNDFHELGTSSEALGHLGFVDMLTRFFKNARNNVAMSSHGGGGQMQWTFRGHAEKPFWRWVCSWARALRRPSDLGFDDSRFELPPLEERRHIVRAARPREGMLFSVPAVGLAEEREERRRTLRERCEKAASLVAHTRKPAVAWCGLNDEGDLLTSLIPGAVQVSGKDSDDEKEEKFGAFVSGQTRVLVTKQIIGAWGLNFQHCAHTTMFASHSFEQYYQSVRRFWRFGQTRPVVVDHVLSDGEQRVIANLRRKHAQAEKLFAELTNHMRDELALARAQTSYEKPEEVPPWLLQSK